MYLYNEKEVHRNYSDSLRGISIDQQKKPNKELKRSIIPKNIIGIEDVNSSTEERGQWFTCSRSSGSSPMLRRNSVSSAVSQDRISRKRSVSNSSTTSRRNKSSEDRSLHDQYISSFHRSLKLLGLQPKDLGITSNHKLDDGSFSYSIPVRNEPTFRTRLTKRTFSLESLKNAIQVQEGDVGKVMLNSLDRKTLANAVYEEWYFRKQEEARKKKESLENEEHKKQEHHEKVKRELKLKADENFIKWKEEKNKLKQQNDKEINVKKTTSEDCRIGSYLRKARPNQEEVFLIWKKEKDKKIKQKKLEELKQENKKEEDRKASAQMAYIFWKKQADESLREKLQESERKKQDDDDRKKRKEQEKCANAEAAFRAWKKIKDAELRKRMTENQLEEERKRDEKSMTEAEKLYEAEQAFEDWLEHVEERRNKQIEAIHRERQKIQRIPWSPGGSVQC